MAKDNLYGAPWKPEVFWEEKKKGASVAELKCIHPDFNYLKMLYSIPSEINIRENIFSFRDSVCQFCGLSCAIDPRKRRKIPEAHFVGKNFIFCSENKKAIRTGSISAGEICPVEIGGCGKIIKIADSAMRGLYWEI